MKVHPSQIENFTFGVEIETTIPTASGIQVGGYHSGRAVPGGIVNGEFLSAPSFNGASWKAEADGSINATEPSHRPCEFVSPILKGEAGVRHLVEFVEWLRKIGAAVNSSCGLHIHVGIVGAADGLEVTEYVERLSRLVNFNSRALYAQTGTLSREQGFYCAPMGDAARKAISKVARKKDARDLANTNRYQLLNLTNLAGTRRTIEFRCFAASRNTSKVLLHLFSVLSLCIVARSTKTANAWANQPLTGEKALRNLLKVRPLLRIVGTEVFATWHKRMLEKAFEMAAKYDKAVAARDLVILTRSQAAA